MSLQIVYSQELSIQPRYRKKKGITQDEHDRNVRCLKMFDRVRATPEAEGDGASQQLMSKTDISEHDTERADTNTTNDASSSGASAGRLPSYSESCDEPSDPPPAYQAGPSNSADGA